MEVESLLLAAIQSSFILGILHGINPCGHSWLVLAPFTTGEKSGKRVFVLTMSFLTGTSLACLLLGLSLGAVAQFIPAGITGWVGIVTSIILLILGVLLLYNPHILHNHDHEHHDHDHDDHHHDEQHCHNHCDHQAKIGIVGKLKMMTKNPTMLPMALFGIGFVNMIIPCPTAAIMYGYALNADSILTATIVFGIYAIATAISVGGVIFLIFKVTSMATSLKKEWVEPLIMRLAGVVIIIFSGYDLLSSV
ncbi:MAG: sulfite exporter TauE/SafE family protein [Desulfotalea sp.]